MAAPARILVVDDEPVIREVIRQVLADDDYVVVEAGTCAEAMERIAADTFAVALVDKNLPDSSGLEIIRHLRGEHPATEVILITAYPTVDSAIEVLKLGAFDYMAKPFPDNAQLRLKVRNAVDKHELSEARRHIASKLAGSLDRLKSVGQANAEVAHEFNNLLVIVLNYVDFIQLRLSALQQIDDDKVRQIASDLAAFSQDVTSAGEAAVSLTRRLQDIADRESRSRDADSDAGHGIIVPAAPQPEHD